jgi:hypothetical protein
VSDYTIGSNFIYISFAWSESETAHKDLFRLAWKHDLGFFDVSSSDGKIWIPTEDGGLQLISSDQQAGQKEKTWWQFWK